MAGKYNGDFFSHVPLSFDKGVDGLNNIAEVPNGYLLEAKNVDLSRPGFIKKRAGYQLYACALPVRCRSVQVTDNKVTMEYDDVTLQFDFIPAYELVVTLSVVSGNDYPDGSYYQPASDQVVFAQVRDYATDPNTNTVTTDTVLEVQIAGAVKYCKPVAVFDNDHFILPKSIFETTAFAAGDYTIRFGSGYTFQRITQSDVTAISVAGVGPVDVTLTFSDLESLKFNVGTLLRFETGLTTTTGASTSKPHYGYISSLDESTNTAVVRLLTSSDYPTVGSHSVDYLNIYYSRGNTFIYKCASLAFYSYNTPDNAPKYMPSCNSLFLDTDNTIVSGSGSGTFNEVGFLLGADCVKNYANILATFNDIENNDIKLVAGYDGNLFLETEPTTRRYNTFETSKLANQIIAVVAGACSITVPDSSEYEVGDIVVLNIASATLPTFTQYTFTVTAIPDPTTLTCTESQGQTINITVRNNTPLPFIRTSREIHFEKEVYDTDPYIFAGSTIQLSSGDIYPTHRVMGVSYESTTSYHTLYIDYETQWQSDSVLYVRNYFEHISFIEADVQDRYESITFPYLLESTPDLSSVFMDDALYVTSSKGGVWKYNGANLINMRIPTPPTCIIGNNENVGGTLLIAEDTNGEFQGRLYNIVITYSYFEFVNGKIKEIESSITPFNSMAYRAVPASDESGNSLVMEVQVPSIPRGIGLPADNIYINAYRTRNGTEDGEADGQILLREVSVPNDPDHPFTIVKVGVLARSIFDELNKPLYASVSDEASEDEYSRNQVYPPLAKHIFEYNNRLVAVNNYDHPYFKFVCNDVFDIDGDFAANCKLIFEPFDSSLQEYRFVTCSVGSGTTAGSVALGGTTYQYAVLSLAKKDVTVASYSDSSFQFRIDFGGVPPLVLNDRVLIRYATGQSTAERYDNYNFNEFEYIVTGLSGTYATVDAPKRWTADFNNGTYAANLPHTVLLFKFDQSIASGTSTVGFICFNKVFNITTAAQINAGGVPAGGGDVLCIRGLGSSMQLKDANDTDNKIYDVDTEVFFEIQGAPTGAGPYTYELKAMKLSSYDGSTGQVTMSYIDPEIGIPYVNLSDTNLEGLTHGPIDIFSRDVTPAYSSYNIEVQDTVEDQVVFSIVGLTAAVGSTVYIEDIPNANNAGKIPSEIGIELNRGLEVTSNVSPNVAVRVSPPKNMFPNFSSTVAGKAIGTDVIDITSTYLEINFNAFALATLGGVGQGQWVFICSVKSKDLTSPLAISGWFKVYQVKDGSDAWQTSITSAGSIKGVRVYIDGDSIVETDLGSLSNLKVLFVGDGSASLPTTYTIVPVPVPNTEYDDLTGKMFGPLDGLTPLEKVIKRYAGAINSVLPTLGFAYWGTSPGAIDDVYPANGFKFIAHNWLQSYYKHAKDTSVDIEDEFEYSIKVYGTEDAYELEGQNGKALTRSGVSSISDDFALDRYPARVTWTPPVGIQALAFREYEGRQDLPVASGKEIVGVATFEDYFLAFTEDSIWKCRINDSGSLLIQQLQSSVGAVSKKAIITTESGIFFMHYTGLYFTNGNTVVKVNMVNRIFEDYVLPNKLLLPLVAGNYNPDAHEIRIGAPISDSIGGIILTYDREFVFNFNQKGEVTSSINQGWSTNTNVPANVWKQLQQSSYFGSTSGDVYRIRTELTGSRYRDEYSAIPMNFSTPYLEFSDEGSTEFIRMLVIQLGAQLDNNCRISVAWNFRTSYDTINTISVDASEIADTKPGLPYVASSRYSVAQRQTIVPHRIEQTSFQFYNDTIDSDGSIYSITALVDKRSSKLIEQRKD